LWFMEKAGLHIDRARYSVCCRDRLDSSGNRAIFSFPFATLQLRH
jgi:hypothetical protein